ncbi:DUF423 domain-containing protein [Alicyclobacillus tolerans]|nr:DUF423 domain-containing protein [Alicyclobacillus montanus]
MFPLFFLAVGAIMAFLAVALGAFAAHGLRQKRDVSELQVFQTGVTYQMYHALAIIGVASLHFWQPQLLTLWVEVCFLVGIILFSGSLYLLTWTRVKRWGAVTPVGGIFFLLGWALLFVLALQHLNT